MWDMLGWGVMKKVRFVGLLLLIMGVSVVFAQPIGIMGQKEVVDLVKDDFALQPQVVFLSIGNAFFSRGLIDQAASAYNTALLHRPDYAKAMNNQGVIALKLGQKDVASYWFEQALEYDAKPLYFYNRGIVAFESEDLQEASFYFEKVVALDNSNANAWFDLGVVLGLQAKETNDVSALQQARQAFESVLALNHNFPNAKQNLLIIEEILNEHE